MIAHWLQEIRQWTYPLEFRIAAEREGDHTVAMQTVVQALEEALARLAEPAVQNRPQGHRASDDDAFMADLATRLWRIREAMRGPNGAESLPGAERSYRHVERFFSKLEELGVTVVDKTGDPYDVGLDMLVVSYETDDRLVREVIKETLLPAVYRNGRRIQQAHIVVAGPTASGALRTASAETGETK